MQRRSVPFPVYEGSSVPDQGFIGYINTYGPFDQASG